MMNGNDKFKTLNMERYPSSPMRSLNKSIGGKKLTNDYWK